MNFDKTGQLYKNVTMLNGWQIREFISAGSGGGVFRVTKSGLGQIEDESALKVIPIIEGNGNFRRMNKAAQERYNLIKDRQCNFAVNEIRVMHDLNGHPNIVTYQDYDFFSWNQPSGFGTVLMIRMDFLKTLSDLEKIEKFPERKIIQIGKDMCKALIYCHDNNVIHRDIKPHNIFRNRAGIYQLGDFGIAKVVNMAQGTGTASGTKLYAPPEQFNDDVTKNYNLTVDIYSLGMVLYEMCNEMFLPFISSSRSVAEAVQKRYLSGCVLPKTKNASAEMEAVLQKACAYYPKDRYQSAQEFLAALEAIPTPKPYDTKQAYTLRELLYYADEEDNVDAQYRLAYWYHMGTQGIVQDEAKAVEWIQRAAKGGHSGAQLNLGLFYIWGMGVEKNEWKGAEWILQSAKQNNVDALYNMGRCYEDGIGVPQDLKIAAWFFLQAAKRGHAAAKKKIDG